MIEFSSIDWVFKEQKMQPSTELLKFQRHDLNPLVRSSSGRHNVTPGITLLNTHRINRKLKYAEMFFYIIHCVRQIVLQLHY